MSEAEWNASTNPAAMLAHVQGKASDRKLRLFAAACCRAVFDRLTDPRSRAAVEVAERRADGDATDDEVRAAILDASDAHGDLLRAGASQERLLPAHAAQWVAPINGFGPENSVREVLHWLPDHHVAFAALLRSICNPFRVALGEPCPKCNGEGCNGHGPLVPWVCDDGWKRKPPAWATDPTVLALAASAYGGVKCDRCKGMKHSITGWKDSPEFDCPACHGSGRTPFDHTVLPILADKLEEAGCTDEGVLDHLRGLDRCGECRGDGLCHEGYKGTSPDDPCRHCAGTGWRPAGVPRVRGYWVVDWLLGKE